MSRPRQHRLAGGDGVLIDGSNENVIRDSLIVNNGPYDGIGVIGGAASNGNIIENNFILDNNIGFSPANNQDIGIRLQPATIARRSRATWWRTAASTASDNQADNNFASGVAISGNANRLEGNSARGNAIAPLISGRTTFDLKDFRPDCGTNR